jgi:tetratricopeptide (TPR) repeat protein
LNIILAWIFVLRARLAKKRRDWAASLAYWDQAIARGPVSTPPSWIAARAGILKRLGRADEAADSLRQGLTASAPNEDLALAFLETALGRARAGRNLVDSERALTQEIESGALKDAPAAIRQLGRVEAAFMRDDAGACAACDPAQAAALAPVELDILLGLEDFAAFARCFDGHGTGTMRRSRAKLLTAVRRRLDLPLDALYAEPKVFGIGLSRTGTTSLSMALDALGIDSAHWENPFTREILSDVDFPLFGACTDISVAHVFETLYWAYPNARFIMTTRPLEPWLASMRKLYHALYGTDDFGRLRDRFARDLKINREPGPVGIQMAMYFDADGFEAARARYEARVHGFFADKPKDRFLELDLGAGAGWAPLCDFLGKPVPAVPFPWTNKAF